MNFHQESLTTLEEMQESKAVLEEFIESYEFLKTKEDHYTSKFILQSSYFNECPRCEIRSRVTSAHPYCTDCNWDSLINQSGGMNKWAA